MIMGILPDEKKKRFVQCSNFKNCGFAKRAGFATHVSDPFLFGGYYTTTITCNSAAHTTDVEC